MESQWELHLQKCLGSFLLEHELIYQQRYFHDILVLLSVLFVVVSATTYKIFK